MLKRIPVQVNTHEWLLLKQNYIGCSDIPVLTGSNRNYISTVELFEQKIGISPINMKMAELPFMGHVMEPVILEILRYFEREQRELWVQNMLQKKVIRNFESNSGYIVVNEDVPFMSTTPDAVIPRGEKDLFGDPVRVDSPINAKNINSIKWHQYDGYIPENHEQIQGEMLVWGSDYSELACLVGGNEFHVSPILKDDSVQKCIYNICKSFWYDRVVPGRVLADRWKKETRKTEKEAIRHDIYQLEPGPDDSEPYRAFLSARFVNQDKQIKASEPMEKLISMYQFYQDIAKGIKAKQNLIKNTLLRVHEHNGVNLILGTGVKSTFNKKHVISGPELASHEVNKIVNNLKLI